jgi:hypothetical protein
LINLAPLLERQKEILSFQFNAKRWNEDPVKYLLEVGISPLLIHEITTNPEHDWYLPIDPTTRRVAMPDFSDAALHDGLASSAPELPELPEFVDTSIQRVAIVHDSGEIHLCVVRLPDVLLTAPNPSFFYGYCETCQRFESFQYGRVLKVIDLLTRKDVPSLHERAKEIYAAGPWEAFKAFMHQHRLILEVAAYVGRSARTNRNRLNEVLISFIRNKFDDLAMSRALLNEQAVAARVEHATRPCG